ncbi:TPA: pilus assembly protein PilR, partial [Klebsiella pneumoniae]|nr:pilus assembly protein PilR [Klebsiella pneumoniae]
MINALQVQVWLQRQLFLAQARVQLYEILLLQLRNRRGVDTALENIREVYSKGGTRSNAHTQLASEALAALADNRPGHRIEDVLRRWLPSNEAAL